MKKSVKAVKKIKKCTKLTITADQAVKNRALKRISDRESRGECDKDERRVVENMSKIEDICDETADKIYENAKEFIQTIIKLKPATAKGTYIKSIFLSSTMSAGIKVDTKSVEA